MPVNAIIPEVAAKSGPAISVLPARLMSSAVPQLHTCLPAAVVALGVRGGCAVIAVE